jgi:Domain of unknown function (DUF4157)
LESYAHEEVKSYEQHEREREEAGSASAPVPEADTTQVERLAAAVGNQAFGVLAREGAGILPDGTAHPDVAAAIARRRGYGEPIEEGLRTDLEKQTGESLHDVRFHKDPEANQIARSVAANAFTVGQDVYFGDGQFNPETKEGKELVRHEVEHVKQQRGAPTSGPLRVSQPGEPLELEAEQAARGLG